MRKVWFSHSCTVRDADLVVVVDYQIAEQEALNRTLLEKLYERERERLCRINGEASRCRLFRLQVNKTVPQVTFHHLPDVDIALCVSCGATQCLPATSVPDGTT